ncbi:MAG: NUDIX domain-containing protein [Candidatus Berkelbacteria bacterium]|nr:NUDIX domain-containing protein [Candidatus Berkelbacteria bacterium]
MKNKEKVGVGFGIMILKDNKVLLGKRHHDPKKADSELHGEGSWTMPGGKMHFGETFEQTCYRETLEETSIEINKNKLKLISLTNDKVPDAHFVTIGFLCQDFTGKPKVMEPDEITKWQWFEINKIPENIFPPSKKMLDNYLSKKIYRAN